jgi:hypothetical protein
VGNSRYIIESLLEDLRVQYSDRKELAYRDYERQGTDVDETHTRQVINDTFPYFDDISLLIPCTMGSEDVLNALVIPPTDDKTIIYEGFRLDTSSLELRQDVPRIRVALYEQNETVTTAVGAYKPADSDQRYSIDISVVKAYRNDKARNAEYELYDMKDDVIQWSKDVDAGAVTNSYIVSFGYDGSSRMIRDNKYVTQTLNFSSKKDLVITQNS